MRTLLLSAGLLASFLQTATAAILTAPPLTVLGTNVFNEPTFTVPVNYDATDTLSFTVDGVVTLQPNDAFGTNDTAVPEPGAWMLACSGVVLMAVGEYAFRQKTVVAIRRTESSPDPTT